MDYSRIHGHRYNIIGFIQKYLTRPFCSNKVALEGWFQGCPMRTQHGLGRQDTILAMVFRTFQLCLNNEVPKCQKECIQNYSELWFLKGFWMILTEDPQLQADPHRSSEFRRPFSFVEVCDASNPALPLVTAHSISSDQLPSQEQLSTWAAKWGRTWTFASPTVVSI